MIIPSNISYINQTSLISIIENGQGYDDGRNLEHTYEIVSFT